MFGTEVAVQVAWNVATECKHFAATGGIPDAQFSCHRYDEILPLGTI
jgi:hypothetical protein